MGMVNFEDAITTQNPPSHVLHALKARNKQQAQENQDKPSMIEPDVWQLIKQHANNPKDMARMNGILRSLFA